MSTTQDGRRKAERRAGDRRQNDLPVEPNRRVAERRASERRTGQDRRTEPR